MKCAPGEAQPPGASIQPSIAGFPFRWTVPEGRGLLVKEGAH